jgi:integrase
MQMQILVAKVQQLCNTSCMKETSSRKQDWPRKISIGRISVSVYKRIAPNGSPCFMVANYATGKRRFDSYATEGEATEAATRLARQLSQRDTKAATLTEAQAVEYVRSAEVLLPFNVTVGAAAEVVAESLKKVGDIAAIHEALKFYTARHKKVSDKLVAGVVKELIAVKESRGASARYLEDLRSRLNKFAEKFPCNIGTVTTANVQAWLDSLNLKSTQTYMNLRRVIHLLFEFSVARGYAIDNPIAGVESLKIRNGSVEIFTPTEIAKLLAVAPDEFLPCIAIGAFAGLRSAEIERLEWSAIDLAGRHIIIGADAAKTASRRVVPIHDNLAAWLSDYAENKGKVWAGTHKDFYMAQQATADAAGLTWKANGLRHSYASYRFAKIGDAGRVAGELGNSASVVHKHYRELVKPAEAVKWFMVSPPDGQVNVPLKKRPAAVLRNLSGDVPALSPAGTSN